MREAQDFLLLACLFVCLPPFGNQQGKHTFQHTDELKSMGFQQKAFIQSIHNTACKGGLSTRPQSDGEQGNTSAIRLICSQWVTSALPSPIRPFPICFYNRGRTRWQFGYGTSFVKQNLSVSFFLLLNTTMLVVSIMAAATALHSAQLLHKRRYSLRADAAQ
mmetsp:Transcript_10922/g.30156  ORF Transcript_10922/g.30156 Transcript_10922/m.30156 type:complete len:162 (-) Transcript_10922:1135-1620(-)